MLNGRLFYLTFIPLDISVLTTKMHSRIKGNYIKRIVEIVFSTVFNNLDFLNVQFTFY